MVGTRAGGIKSRDKNLAKNPNFYRDIGVKGGKISRGGGFATDPELASKAGRIGGLKSRRGKVAK